MLVTTIVASVFPKNVEGENLAVILYEAVEILVGTATLKHDLDIVLVLSKIRRVLLHGDHCSSPRERIFWIALRAVKSDTLVGVESTSKVVGIDNTEDAAIDVEVDADVKVPPSVGLGLKTRDKDLMALKKNTLRDTGVLYLVLKNVQGVIIKVIEDSALADTIVLIGALYDGLLEVAFEV